MQNLFFPPSKHSNLPPKMSALSRGQIDTWYLTVTSCDVDWFAKENKMAANKKVLKKRGGRYCAAGTPNQESCKNTSYTPGITMHLFPTEPKCRAQWIKFVQRHRVDFGEPINQYASLCSAHFEPSCFENSLARSMGFKVKNNLETGSIPTRHAVDPKGPEVFSDRRKRQVSVFRSMCIFFTFTFSCSAYHMLNLNIVSEPKILSK